MQELHPILDLSQHPGRVFVVGDIHGCYTKLMEELSKINFDQSQDILLSVGDLVDRGPENLKCLNLVAEPWFHAVRGNHELLMWDSLAGTGNSLNIWLCNGGQWIYTEDLDLMPDDYRLVIQNAMVMLPLTLTVKLPGGKTIGLVHAEPPADWDKRAEAREEVLVWSRSMIGKSKYGSVTPIENIDHVYCGHTPEYDPVHSSNVSWIDTGACFRDGHFTIVEVRP